MKWPRVTKTTKPGTLPAGGYRAWKRILAREGQFRCIYCAIHEAAFGGYWNFHVEHYKPKSRFRDLKDAFENLFYACAVCNVFKSNDWPGECRPDLSTCAYANPIDHDFNTLFTLLDDGSVRGETKTSEYMVLRLNLNRPQLIMERRIHLLRHRRAMCERALKSVEHELENVPDRDIQRALAELVKVISKLTGLESDLQQTRPYSEDQTKAAN